MIALEELERKIAEILPQVKEFRHALHQTDNTSLNSNGRAVAVRKPDKSQQQLAGRRQGIVKCLFMQSESLAYLTLDTVAVDSMLEVFLRYTDQQLYGRFVSRTLL